MLCLPAADLQSFSGPPINPPLLTPTLSFRLQPVIPGDVGVGIWSAYSLLVLEEAHDQDSNTEAQILILAG